MEGARRLLDTLHGAPSLEERPRKEGDGEAPDKVLVDYSMDCRRKQKMMCGQLQVLRLLLEFLLHADHASWEEDSLETLSLKEEEVKRSWKMLKAEYQEKVTETERLLPQLIQRLQRLHNKRRELEEGLQRHENKVTSLRSATRTR
ncbi:outer kinetochore KNL1 complex subunit ZWINT isoform X2 [Ascaphus truei]|uniref:outer kinetochore KNL1 complex subunit ZWINT isoform X2 n=1 Tax=Ascaphus truei TaxID=8439 RepID=UPI003F594CDD